MKRASLVAAIALAATAAAAQPRVGETHVRWAEAPTRAEVAAAAPETPGRALLNCRLSGEGRLRDCRLVSEEPAFVGLRSAALSLIPRFRLETAPGARSPDGLRTLIPFQLSRTPAVRLERPPFSDGPPADAIQAALAPLAETAPEHRVRAVADCLIGPDAHLTDCRPVSGAPDWQAAAQPLLAQFVARRWTETGEAAVGARVTVALSYQDDPTGALSAMPEAVEHPVIDPTAPRPEMMRFYPERAQRAGVTGGAVVECRFLDDGGLSGCHALSETPPGFGFGEAAARLIGTIRFRPLDREGRPVGGRRYRTTFTFSLRG